jgi:tetratricopeptide (TPR) repeat protein
VHFQSLLGDPDAPATGALAVAAAEEGDAVVLGLALAGFAQSQLVQGHLDEAEEAIERAHGIFGELEHPEGLHYTDELMGVSRHLRGDLEGALAFLLRSRDGYFEMRGTAQAGWTHIHLASVQLDLGQLDDAEVSARTGIAEFQSRHDPRGLAAAYIYLGRTHAARGDTERARVYLDEALEIAHRWQYPIETTEAEAALGLLETA